ncbi:hypothetical protein MAR_004865 [Mya arenaria]|uniref:Uncharacterized protein n=1 Tax=Mya arenaria TaxID=6604 RepID=A0ABY7EY10_MYAAR|nr:hypothetical protein MAR_004865 [Mya arenaria]
MAGLKPSEEYGGCASELMLRIRQLETHVKVLQRASKEENPVAPPMPRMAMKRKKKFRPIDFNKYVHHVALTIMYLGHDYTGYDDTEEVVSLDVRGNLLSGVGVKLMEEAGTKLIGEYDFRNFYKFNVKDGITNYVRKIIEVEVKTLDETDDGFTMCNSRLREGVPVASDSQHLLCGVPCWQRERIG